MSLTRLDSLARILRVCKNIARRRNRHTLRYCIMHCDGFLCHCIMCDDGSH